MGGTQHDRRVVEQSKRPLDVRLRQVRAVAPQEHHSLSPVSKRGREEVPHSNAHVSFGLRFKLPIVLQSQVGRQACKIGSAVGRSERQHPAVAQGTQPAEERLYECPVEPGCVLFAKAGGQPSFDFSGLPIFRKDAQLIHQSRPPGEQTPQQHPVDPATKTFFSVEKYDRHTFIVAGQKLRILVDIDCLDRKPVLFEQIAGIVAKMTAFASVKDCVGWGHGIGHLPGAILAWEHRGVNCSEPPSAALPLLAKTGKMS